MQLPIETAEEQPRRLGTSIFDGPSILVCWPSALLQGSETFRQHALMRLYATSPCSRVLACLQFLDKRGSATFRRSLQSVS